MSIQYTLWENFFGPLKQQVQFLTNFICFLRILLSAFFQKKLRKLPEQPKQEAAADFEKEFQLLKKVAKGGTGSQSQKKQQPRKAKKSGKRFFFLDFLDILQVFIFFQVILSARDVSRWTTTPTLEAPQKSRIARMSIIQVGKDSFQIVILTYFLLQTKKTSFSTATTFLWSKRPLRRCLKRTKMLPTTKRRRPTSRRNSRMS